MNKFESGLSSNEGELIVEAPKEITLKEATATLDAQAAFLEEESVRFDEKTLTGLKGMLSERLASPLVEIGCDQDCPVFVGKKEKE